MRELSIIKPLDGVRALAIILVLVWHYFNCQVAETATGLMKALKFLTSWTWSGVDLFFILSGFLIGRILIVNKKSPSYFKTFYLRRIFRIFPAYYLVVLAFVVIIFSGASARLPWLTHDPFPLYSYILYIQNFWMASISEFGPNWLSVTWSLALEEQFYILLPVIVLLVKDKWLPVVLIIGIVAAPVSRSCMDGLSPYVLLPARMDALLLGVLIAYYYLTGAIENYFTKKKRGMAAFLVIVCVSVFLCSALPGEGIGGVYIHSLLVLFYGTLLVLVLTLNPQQTLARFLAHSWLAFLARLSFMIYLTHQVFSGLFHELLLKQEPQLHNYKDVLVTLLALGITLLFSALSYHVFEKPLLKLGKKFSWAK